MQSRLAEGNLLPEIYRIVEAAYPEEGCGFVFEERGGDLMVISTLNRATQLHRMDPEAYPRDGRNYFEPDMKPWLRAVRQGHTPRVIFHSHPETDAYFSDTDRDSALLDDDGETIERHPGVFHLVVSVRGRPPKAQVSRLYAFSQQRRDFVHVGTFDAEGELADREPEAEPRPRT